MKIKKQFGLGLISQVIGGVTGLLILMLCSNALTPSELALWFIVNAISGVAIMMDLGMMNTFQRNFTYTKHGISELLVDGLSNIKRSKNSEGTVGIIYTVATMYYMAASVLSLLLMGILYNIFTREFNIENRDAAGILIYFISSVIILNGNKYIALLQGFGMMKEFYVSQIVFRMALASGSIIAYLRNPSLMDFAIASICASVIYFVIIKLWIKKKVKYNATFNMAATKNTIKMLTPNAIRQGISAIGSFLGVQGFILLSSHYLLNDEFNVLSMAVTILVFLSNVSNVPAAIAYPKICATIINNDKQYTKRLIAIGLFASSLLFVVTSVIAIGGILTLGKYVHGLNIPVELLILLALMVGPEQFQSNCCSFLAAYNNIEFHKTAIVTAIITLLLIYAFAGHLNMGVYGVVGARIIAHWMYNNWYWAIKCFNRAELTIDEIAIIAKQIYRTHY